MNFELSQDQQLMRETFARFLDEEGSAVRTRPTLPSGFDQAMWTGLAELGAFGPRVPQESGGLGLVPPGDLTAPESLSKRTGPAGFLNQCYRHAQGTTIYGGASEIHRSMIAERALQLPRTRA
jgi:alkylation response protein AidB-like acyl-CoA dehydrogenase